MNAIQQLGNFLNKHLLTPAEPKPILKPMARAGQLVYTHDFNGEKNLGEIGPMKSYALNYMALSTRSYQSFIESEITQTVIKKYTVWSIGAGLKMQANPNKVLLKTEGINIDTENFNEVAEARWQVWANSRNSSYTGMKSLNTLMNSAFKNSIIGGDVLVVLRYIDNEVKVQLIDGAHVASPMYGSDWQPFALANGNEVRNGVEISPKGEHVAYYVRYNDVSGIKYERIEARGAKTGLLMAFLVYGLEYRLDSTRGMPLIACILETLKKLERYKEATVGSAEERQKIVYAVQHKEFSTGQSPLTKGLSKAFNADASDDDIPIDEQGRQLANLVSVSTDKQAFNLPLGASLELLESKNELYFKEFYDKNIDIICASIGIPPNVAMSLYNDSFSASRAAIKDWENTLNVVRADFSFQFLQPIYDLWLHTEILRMKVQAPGYLKAFKENNNIVISAYRTARFTGANVPHIDPVKEVTAERMKLGNLAGDIPLTTIEQSTEALNGGDSDSNLAQFAEELKHSKKLGIKPEPEPMVIQN